MKVPRWSPATRRCVIENTSFLKALREFLLGCRKPLALLIFVYQHEIIILSRILHRVKGRAGRGLRRNHYSDVPIHTSCNPPPTWRVRLFTNAFLLYGVFLQESAFLDIGWISSFAGGRR